MTEVKSSTVFSNLYRHLSAVYCFFTVSRVLRVLQFTFAIVVAVLYGIDLAHFTKIHAHADAEWIYAEFVAAVSAIACLVFSLMTSIHIAWSVLDATIFVLWLAQVGVFGSIFYPEVRPEYAKSTLSVARMHAAVWIDLVNLVLWLLTALLRVAWYINSRKHYRRNNTSKGYSTPFLGFLGRSRDSHIYSDQEYGCLDLDREKPNGGDTKVSDKKWAEGINTKMPEKANEGSLKDNYNVKSKPSE